jgi:hypothetical protein
MKKVFPILFMALLMLFGTGGAASAEIVTYSFIGYIEDGYRMGDFGTGSFSYDNSLIQNGDEFLDPNEGDLVVEFNFDGQVFSNHNDIDFDDFPVLQFNNEEPVYLDYLLVNGENGVSFLDTNLMTLETSDLIPAIEDRYDFETSLIIETVPIPGAVWLLGSGFIGLAALRRKNAR